MRAIDEYRKGGRKNPIMKGFAANLKDEDLKVIAKYFGTLTPGREDRVASLHHSRAVSPGRTARRGRA